MGYIAQLLKTATSSATTITQLVVALVALVMGGFLVTKAILAFKKRDFKEVVLFAVAAAVVFLLSALVANNFFSQAGQSLAASDPNALLSV